ncbi:MAG: hypothetical protein EAX90_09025 [Candidatus Heimdallarchaeota archaeon]|nr:hypothetical protein [Candidatus Heimdallarchaeota archaeon]
MSQTNNLFHICHVMFSSGITRPEVAKSLNEMKDILQLNEEINVETAFKDLIEQGYVGIFEERYFLLGKGIVAVAAIFT